MTFLTVDRGDKVRERGCQLSKWPVDLKWGETKQFSKFSARTPPTLTEGNRVSADPGRQFENGDVSFFLKKIHLLSRLASVWTGWLFIYYTST